MKQIIIFKCEECGKKFETKEEADKHEQFCSRKTVPIKVIYLTYDNQFGIITYPKSIYLKQEYGKDKVNLMPTSRYDYCDYFYNADQFKFDQIKCAGQYIFIYTTNFSKEYEEECFKKLVNFKINQVEKDIELLKQELIILQGNVKTKYMDEKNIKHEENMFIEELDS